MKLLYQVCLVFLLIRSNYTLELSNVLQVWSILFNLYLHQSRQEVRWMLPIRFRRTSPDTFREPDAWRTRGGPTWTTRARCTRRPDPGASASTRWCADPTRFLHAAPSPTTSGTTSWTQRARCDIGCLTWSSRRWWSRGPRRRRPPASRRCPLSGGILEAIWTLSERPENNV